MWSILNMFMALLSWKRQHWLVMSTCSNHNQIRAASRPHRRNVRCGNHRRFQQPHVCVLVQFLKCICKRVNTYWCVKDLIVANRGAQIPADVKSQVSVTRLFVSLNWRATKDNVSQRHKVIKRLLVEKLIQYMSWTCHSKDFIVLKEPNQWNEAI